MFELKLQRFGDALGVILPQEAVERLGARAGDALYLVEDADGGYRLTAQDPELAEKLAKADEIMDRYRNALRELAE